MQPRLAVIFLTVAVDLIGFGIVIPLLPLYAQQLGAGGLEIGFLFASYSLMQFLFAPLWGRLSDRIGRRPVLLVSIAGNAVGFLLFAVAQGYWWLVLARVVSGICTANLPVANAYIADITTPEQRARGMGLMGAAFGIGFVIGPFLGGELAAFGYSAPPFFAAGLAALNWVSAFVFVRESLPVERRAKDGRRGPFAERLDVLRKVPHLAGLLGLVAMQIGAFSLMEVSFVLFAERRLGFGAQQAGRVFAYIGVVMVIVQGGLIGPLVRRLGERRVALLGLAALAAGLALIPLTPPGGWPALLVFSAFIALGSGLTTPSLSSILSRSAPHDVQGIALGLSHSTSALARVLGPPVGGLLFDWGGENAPFGGGAALMALAFMVALWRLPRVLPVLAPPAARPAAASEPLNERSPG